jgi:RNA polymerase sigma-70 factor (ECF subfamily)
VTGARFQPTRWSLIASARDEAGAGARRALGELCEAYWYPLYAFLRRRGSAAADAADLTQGFFAALIEKGYVADADPDRGRFRTFLLAALEHYVAKEWAKARARKRGGDRTRLSLDLDFEDGERRFGTEATHEHTPEALYERRWALAVLERALAGLAHSYRKGTPEAAERFEALRPFLAGAGGEPYRDVAERLGTSEMAVKVAVHRMRRRYRDLLRAEIAETVGHPSLVDGEIRRLMEAVRT